MHAGGTIDVGPLPHALYNALSVLTGAASLAAIFAPNFLCAFRSMCTAACTLEP